MGNKANYLYQVGDIVEMKNGKIQILNLGQYKSGGQNYTIKCLNCNHIRTIDKKGMINKSECQFCSKNKFKLSEDGTYWIGTTQNGIDFWFNGDNDIINYIKSQTWRETCYGYFQNKEGYKLHRIVMNVIDKNIYVNHIGGNRRDNRIESLSISNCLDNSKEKKVSSRNNSGIVGLMSRGKNGKWVGNIKIKDISVYTKYKTKDEALIDLLIIQQHYGFRHNTELYYLLDSVSQERIYEVIENIERQLNKERNDKIVSSNIYKLSQCNTYYNVYDKNNNCFKINIESKSFVENGIWYVAIDKSHQKPYVHGNIIIDGYRKTVKLHRYLFDLLDVKYKNIFVDHLNGDSLDNRMCNLELTDANGNGKNKPSKGYSVRWGKPRAMITINGKTKTKTFETEKEAIKWYNKQKEKSLNNRLTFKSKEEVDRYLNNIENK